MDLQFQNFSSNEPNSSKNAPPPSGMLGSTAAPPGQLPEVGGGPPAGTKHHFLQLSFYQQYFDVDQDQVLTRILNSVYPRRTGNYIADYIQPNPDLYGPFWISTTLVFAIAILGNLVHFVRTYGSGANVEYIADFQWVTAATSLVFGYVIALPSIIYTFLWHRKSPMQYGYFDLLCAYGYSLSVFIPATFLWFLVPYAWFHWLLTISSTVFTGAVLAISLWPAVRTDPNRLVAFGFIAGVVLAHVLLALCFKAYFFDTALPPIPSSAGAGAGPEIDAVTAMNLPTPAALINNGSLNANATA